MWKLIDTYLQVLEKDMEKIWKRYGKDMEKIWKKCEKNVEKMWEEM